MLIDSTRTANWIDQYNFTTDGYAREIHCGGAWEAAITGRGHDCCCKCRAALYICFVSLLKRQDLFEQLAQQNSQHA
jgi:hypothetical protein